MDLFSLDSDVLGALDRAVAGNRIVTTEFFNRVVGTSHLDLMVGGVVGIGPPYLLHVHALDSSRETVLANATLAIDDDLDDETKLAVLLVYTMCLTERAARQMKCFALKGISFHEKESQNRGITAMPKSRTAIPPVSRRRRVRP